MTVVLGVGDTGARREDPASMFSGCREALAAGDIVFGQLETTITDRGAKAPNARLAMRAPSTLAPALCEAGFDVMSFAGNHCLDWGYEGFFDTLSHMETAGVKLCGAGPNLDQARQAVVLEVNGIRVAFLACSSILPEGYWADAERPGCAPLRAHTLYQPIEQDQPGTPARTISHPHRIDLDELLTSIAAARAAADIVLVSMHWGVHLVEAVIADYQRIVAHAAIDAGAHAILGHHPHILKGVEIYRKAPVFYSLGNFAIEQPHIWDAEITRTASFRHLLSLNPGWNTGHVYMLPEDTRMTGIARLALARGGVERVEFLPAWIGDDSAPCMLDPGDPRFDRVRDYLQRISASQGFTSRFLTVDSCLRID
jgi:poly-gamma-glutamate capsule biosynthesis protein CapA/YwtB (metallophosphatase superfamily)